MKEYQLQYRPEQAHEIIQLNGYNVPQDKDGDKSTWVTFERAYALETALYVFYKWCEDTPSLDKRILLVTEDVVCEYTGQEVTE